MHVRNIKHKTQTFFPGWMEAGADGSSFNLLVLNTKISVTLILNLTPPPSPSPGRMHPSASVMAPKLSTGSGASDPLSDVVAQHSMSSVCLKRVCFVVLHWRVWSWQSVVNVSILRPVIWHMCSASVFSMTEAVWWLTFPSLCRALQLDVFSSCIIQSQRDFRLFFIGSWNFTQHL